MRVLILRHADFEDSGLIDEWISNNRHYKEEVRLYAGESMPKIDNIDMLIVMGGPMNVYEEEKYPFLIKEKEYIGNAVLKNKYVIGICLGAQLLSVALGGEVIRNREKEIGWFCVKKEDGLNSRILDDCPEKFIAFHWHGDTFTIPDGACKVFSSEGCDNQGFIYSDRVIGLQFHIEMTAGGINQLLNNCHEDITNGNFIQKPQKIKDTLFYIDENREIMFNLLSNLTKAEGNLCR